MYLSTEQAIKAKEWYVAHKSHVDTITKGVKTHYEPTLFEDKNNPALWKAEHWVHYFISDDYYKVI